MVFKCIHSPTHQHYDTLEVYKYGFQVYTFSYTPTLWHTRSVQVIVMVYKCIHSPTHQHYDTLEVYK